jgi:hypothetical protein
VRQPIGGTTDFHSKWTSLILASIRRMTRRLCGDQDTLYIKIQHLIGRYDDAGREDGMTRAELDVVLARLGLEVPEREREEIVAAAPLIEDMLARLRPHGGRDVAAEPAHLVRFPEG